jgi:Xaa-Pro aminopeptidase
MFQSFETTASPANGAPRVSALRERLASLGIDGFLVPRADEFQGEYVPASAERLSWLTGFTGSAGAALVAPHVAVVFVDGRYVTQLAQQTDPDVFTPGDLIKEPPADWIANHAGQSFRLGIDPWLHTIAEVRKLKAALEAKGGALVFLPENPLDALWTDRPAEPLGRVTIQKHQHSGTLSRDKIAAIAEGVRTRGGDAVLIADPSSVAWAFNIRGSDVPHTPHPLARAIIHADGLAELFLDARKTGIEEKAYLTQICELREPAELAGTLSALGQRGATVEVDAGIVSYELVRLIEAAGGKVKEATDPAPCPAPPRTTPSSPAPAPPIYRTAWPWSNSWPALMKPRPERSPKSTRSKDWKPAAAAWANACRTRLPTSPSTRFQALARTARSSITALPAKRTDRSNPANSSSSIPAASIATARPISPARSLSAASAKRRSASSRWCSRA